MWVNRIPHYKCRFKHVLCSIKEGHEKVSEEVISKWYANFSAFSSFSLCCLYITLRLKALWAILDFGGIRDTDRPCRGKTGEGGSPEGSETEIPAF